MALDENLGKLEPMRTRAVWVMRVLWFFLPLSLGALAGDAISSAPNAVPQVLTVGLWVLWAAGLLAAMVPLPATLTALRVLAAGTLPLVIWAILDVDIDALVIVSAVHVVAMLFVVFNPLIGDRFVDGGSYGDERRMLLRPPAQVSYALVPVVGALMAAGAATGPLLLGDRRWLFGIVATVLGFAILAGGVRALHQLSRRWIVFVPTGMVLHDLMALTEPVLFRRTAIERLGAAIAGSPARDLSNRAPGLLLECELADAAPLGLRDPNDRNAATQADVRRFLFCPSRPGALLDEADTRNIATG